MSESKPAYISKVHLKGYKSIKDLEIDLQPGLNIIIGPNGSGKTNFLEILSDISQFEFDRFYNNLDEGIVKYYLNSSTFEYSIKVSNKSSLKKIYYTEGVKEGSIVIYKNEISKNEKRNIYQNNIQVGDEDEIFENVLQYFNCNIIQFNIPNYWYEYSFDRNSIQIEKHPNGGFYILTHGAEPLDWVSESIRINIKTLKTINRKNLHKVLKINSNIIDLLKRYTPIDDVRINEYLIEFNKSENNQIQLDNLKLEFNINGSWFFLENLSDGTKRLFYIFSELLYPIKKANVYLVEEPELGLHPNQLQKLMQFLREQSKEKQIIITTHSPEVLNILGEDELDRIIVTRYDSEKGTKMYKLSEKEKTHVHNYMKYQASISDYWIQSGFEKENEEEVTS